MKKILAVALLIASAGAFPTVTPAFADSSNDRLCGPDAPEGYKRPGGYCEQIDKKGSLMELKDCDYQLPASLVDFKLQDGVPVLVAEYCGNVKETMVTL